MFNPNADVRTDVRLVKWKSDTQITGKFNGFIIAYILILLFK